MRVWAGTARQAAVAGYSPQLLRKYLGNGRVARVRRGVYRIVHFPASDHEDLVMLWNRMRGASRKRALPARASKPVRAEIKTPRPGKADLGWSGGKAGT